MLVIFLVAIVFHVGAIWFSCYAGFSRDIPPEIIYLSSFDLLLSFVVVALAIKQFPALRGNSYSIFKSTYLQVLEKWKCVLIIFLLFGAYSAYTSFQLIVSGVLRHELLGEHDRGGAFYMVFSAFFKILVPMVLYFGASRSIKVIALTGLLISILITASRSELRYVIHFFLVLLIFSGRGELIGKSLKFFILASLMIFVAILATSILQGRPISQGIGALMDITRTVFRYRAYGYYLSEISIESASSLDKLLFPFLGYISEFFIRFASQPEIPVNSEYVAHLHYLGTDNSTGRPLLANVVYPWWSWFFGVYGFWGLLLKAVFIYCLMVICFSARMLFTSVLLLSFVLLGTAVSHPLMTLTHTMSFVVVLMIDIAVKILNVRGKIGDGCVYRKIVV